MLAQRQQDATGGARRGLLGGVEHGRGVVARPQQVVEAAQQRAGRVPQEGDGVAGAARRQGGLDPAVEARGVAHASGDLEDVGGARKLRVLVRVQPLAEPLPRLPVARHVAELGRDGDGVQRLQQGAALGAAERAEPGRRRQRDIAAGDPAGEPQHVGHRVHQQRPPGRQTHLVDDGAVLPHRDALGLVGAEPGQGTQRRQILLRERHLRARQREVELARLFLQARAQVQHGHPVAGQRQQLGVRDQQVGVTVLVAAVTRQLEQVQRRRLDASRRRPGRAGPPAAGRPRTPWCRARSWGSR